MIAPDARHFVEHGLGRMGVIGHELEREIRGDKRVGERGEGESNQDELKRRCRLRHGHPAGHAPVRAPKRHHHLKERKRKRQDQREVPKFYNHGRNIARVGLSGQGQARHVAVDFTGPCSGPVSAHLA